MKAMRSACLVAAIVGLVAPGAAAQDSKSAPLVKQLIEKLDAAKLDLIAAKDPNGTGTYVSALYVPGSQLLVVSASYAQPALMDTRLEQKDYAEVYMDLNTAAEPGTRVSIEDTLADGLKAVRAANIGGDSFELKGARVVFDNDWKKQRMTEDAYRQAFQDADSRYAHMLTALLKIFGDDAPQVAAR